jgi:hypothetical protein
VSAHTCHSNGMCEALSERCGEGRGFKAINSIDLSQKVGEAETKFVGVAYKKSASDKGLMLNLCPFCGGQPGYFKRNGDVFETIAKATSPALFDGDNALMLNPSDAKALGDVK